MNKLAWYFLCFAAAAPLMVKAADVECAASCGIVYEEFDPGSLTGRSATVHQSYMELVSPGTRLAVFELLRTRCEKSVDDFTASHPNEPVTSVNLYRSSTDAYAARNGRGILANPLDNCVYLPN